MTCEPAAVPAARHWTTEQLDLMYASAPTADDVALVVSELVSNCVRAEAHTFTLALEGHHERLRVEAADDAPGM
ncbi:MAG: ATP-binding protein, partial [Jatrophihabitans sp.]|uniref:ATP-binding protein n=1 Tax=Jatrophihabitans sp. TaxID=1932789 RepID=UPI003F7F1046